MENEIVLAKEEYAALKEFARPVRSPEGFMVLIDRMRRRKKMGP